MNEACRDERQRMRNDREFLKFWLTNRKHMITDDSVLAAAIGVLLELDRKEELREAAADIMCEIMDPEELVPHGFKHVSFNPGPAAQQQASSIPDPKPAAPKVAGPINDVQLLRDRLVEEAAHRIHEYEEAYPEVGMGMSKHTAMVKAIENLKREGILPPDYEPAGGAT